MISVSIHIGEVFFFWWVGGGKDEVSVSFLLTHLTPLVEAGTKFSCSFPQEVTFLFLSMKTGKKGLSSTQLLQEWKGKWHLTVALLRLSFGNT